MTWRWASLLAGAALLVLGPVRLEAQKGIEGGLHAQGNFADFTLVGGGAHFSLRPGGRTRFTLAASPGAIEGEFAFRGEITAQFMLNPSSLKQGFYAGGGVAGVAGALDEGYLLLVLGFETRPGGRSGWVVETGIGGGVRVLLGYRWRKIRR
jgi:hypothetical protein